VMPAPPAPPATQAAPSVANEPGVRVSIGRVEFLQAPAQQPVPRRAPRGFSGQALERRYLDRRWY
jgi:hypothetical protein